MPVVAARFIELAFGPGLFSTAIGDVPKPIVEIGFSLR